MEIAGRPAGSNQMSPSHERSGKPAMEGKAVVEGVRRQPARSNQMSLAFERQVFEKRSEEGKRLSCTLITGFLGSGKTTLVRHILQHRAHLRIAVLVNDYADLDIDSLLLDTSVNSAFGLPSVSLVNGCACCNVSGKFKEAVSQVVRSKHNFDHLVIETSGLADPVKIAKDLRGMGVQLDVIVTVVDVEALEKVVRLPIALEQLTIADVVLVNKCDLASLGAISDVEDLIDRETKGSKAVRCKFCKVPLELVLNISNSAAIPSVTTSTVKAFAGVLSHEACSGSAYLRPSFKSSMKPTSRGTLETRELDVNCAKSVLKQQGQDAVNSETHSLGSIASLSFSSSVPLRMTKVQSIITDQMFHLKGLVRAKGVLWLNENRRIRLVFHWSGKKRSEATYGGQWECAPSTSLIFIGLHKDELDLLKHAFTIAQVDLHQSISNASSPEQGNPASQFAEIVAADTRFKVCRGACQSQGQIGTNDSQACVTFGLVGSPLRGVHEADLNQALMHTVNAQGILFLTAVTSSREDHLLQVAFDETNGHLETIWKELSTAATSVRAKFFKNVHNCSCDLKDHNH